MYIYFRYNFVVGSVFLIHSRLNKSLQISLNFCCVDNQALSSVLHMCYFAFGPYNT